MDDYIERILPGVIKFERQPELYFVSCRSCLATYMFNDQMYAPSDPFRVWVMKDNFVHGWIFLEPSSLVVDWPSPCSLHPRVSY